MTIVSPYFPFPAGLAVHELSRLVARSSRRQPLDADLRSGDRHWLHRRWLWRTHLAREGKYSFLLGAGCIGRPRQDRSFPGVERLVIMYREED